MVTTPTKATGTTKKAPARRTAAPKGQVLTALDAFLRTLDLDEAQQTNAAIARALATKLDQAKADQTGAVAMAVAGLAKELRSVVDAIADATSGDDDLMGDLFSDD